MNHKAATARSLGPPTRRDDWMPPKETPMDTDPAGRAIEEAQQRVSLKMARLMTAEVVAEAVENATGQRRSSVLIAGKLLDALERAGYDVTPRASQAATATNGAGCDAGAAHGGDGDSADRTALRDRIRDAFHAIAPDCVAYHATDCIGCTTRADAIMRDQQNGDQT